MGIVSEYEVVVIGFVTRVLNDDAMCYEEFNVCILSTNVVIGCLLKGRLIS